MAAFNKFQQFSEDLAKGVHNLSTGALTVALCSNANIPSASLDAVLADITQISYTNLSARVPTLTSCEQTAGVTKLILQDLVLTASGAVGPFQHVVLYNDTPTSPLDPLIGFYSHTSEVTLAAGETFTIDFDTTNGVLTIT